MPFFLYFIECSQSVLPCDGNRDHVPCIREINSRWRKILELNVKIQFYSECGAQKLETVELEDGDTKSQAAD